MTSSEIRAEIKWTLDELEWLHFCSVRQHGESFVRFSTTYRDPFSKRRVRLTKTYWALKRML